MSRFLPPPVTSFQLGNNNALNDFTSHPITVLRDVLPCGIHFEEGDTEARVPTAFSRAYLFYFCLSRGFILPPAPGMAPVHQTQNAAAIARQESAGAIRNSLRGGARNAFRGLLSLFALRNIFGLEIEAKETLPLLDGGTNVVRRMLARQAAGDPKSKFWDRLPYFVLKTGPNQQLVLAGASPFTAFFPAARALTGMPELIYWYHPQEGWLDPGLTDRRDWANLRAGQQALVRHALRSWVQAVVEQLTEKERAMQSQLQDIGMEWDDIVMLTAEFQAWQADLDLTRQQDSVEVPADEITGVQTRPFGNRTASFLSLCVLSNRSVFTDFALVDGRLLVTTEKLLQPSTRIFGDTRGNPAFAQRLATLPFEGDDLGKALGLPEKAVPLPFRYLNRVFTPKLTQLTEQDLGKEWRALELASSEAGSLIKTKFLFPVASFILPQLSLHDIPAAVSVTDSPGSDVFIVTVRINGAEVSQRYNDPAFPDFVTDKTIDPGYFDLRLFPNLNLDEVEERVLPRAGDLRDYYVRLRLSPQWVEGDNDAVPVDLLTAWRNAAKTSTAENAAASQAQPIQRGSALVPKEVIDEGTIRDGKEFGSERFYASGISRILRFGERPDAFYVKDRGLCLVTLPPGPGKNLEKLTWKVAVDFGTSNTCVAVSSSNGMPELLPFSMLTTSLLRAPEYSPLKGTAEGQSPNLDFFAFDPNGFPVQAEEYFPTQICTRRQKPMQDQTNSVRNGLILFRNISQSVLYNATIADLLVGYEMPVGEGVSRVKSRFRLEQNIKWRPLELWSDVFMHDLRRSIVLAAALKNAHIENIVFSYPKAFTRAEQRGFQGLIEAVWKSSNLEPAKMSESEGVRNYIADRDWKDCIVLDIGGGTTDVLAFRGKSAFFQTSFRFAADVIDSYVVASAALRDAVCDAASAARVEDAGKLKDALSSQLSFFKKVPLAQPPARTVEMDKCQTVWHGLLYKIAPTADKANRLRASLCDEIAPQATPDKKKAIAGFFITLLTSFGGLAYLCGLSHRAMSQKSGQPLQNEIILTFIGNGGKYYEFLNDGDTGLPRFLEQMFREGAGLDSEILVSCKGVFQDKDGKQRPKAAIVLGMLTPGAAPESIEVCNGLGEKEVYIGERRFSETDPLIDFYRAAQGKLPEFRVGEGSALHAFLAALDKHCARGKFNDGVVVPEVGPDWATKLHKTLQRDFDARLRSRLGQNAALLPRDDIESKEGAIQVAVEPLFISELAALLLVVREQYAGG